jgi:hypothetical protein
VNPDSAALAPLATAASAAAAQELSDLRADTRVLGQLLGRTLARQDSPELLALVEEVRRSARQDLGATSDRLDGIDVETAIRLARAFSTYFHLANVTEQVHRSRVQRDVRRVQGDPISAAARRIDSALASGEVTPDSVAAAVARLSARPVFTAHPTEAARRSVLTKLRAIADLLDDAEREGRSLEHPRVQRRAAELVDLLWQTDELRLDRPEVLDEARNAIYYLDDLARGPAAQVLDDLAAALESIGVTLPPDARPLSFGSWIGGDRDGNPFVTPAVTRQVVDLARDHAVRDLLPVLDRLISDLSVSERHNGISAELRTSLDADLAVITELEPRYRGSTPRSPTASSSRACGRSCSTPARASRPRHGRTDPAATTRPRASCSTSSCSCARRSSPTAASSRPTASSTAPSDRCRRSGCARRRWTCASTPTRTTQPWARWSTASASRAGATPTCRVSTGTRLLSASSRPVARSRRPRRRWTGDDMRPSRAFVTIRDALRTYGPEVSRRTSSR